MKANNIKLIVVMVAAIIGSGLCAKQLVTMQKSMNRSNTVKHASKLPIAGFQKFMADIVWMRFINYAGTNPLTEKNKDTYKYYVDTIIAMDPDFFDIYEWGAMFLQQVDIELALEVIDKGLESPRIKDRYKLPMLAGQMLMRPEWNKFYADGEKGINKDAVRRARRYYYIAAQCPDAIGSCMGCYIRTGALLMDNGLPKKLNELQAWKEYFEQSAMPEGMDHIESEMGGVSNGPLDVENRLLSQIKYVAEDYGTDRADAEMKEKAKELILSVIDTFFPGRPFDMESFRPYATNNMDHHDGTISMPMKKTYVVELESPHAFALEHVTFKLAKGTAVVTVLIDGNPVEGLTDISVGTTRQSVPDIVTRKVEEDGEATPAIGRSTVPSNFKLRKPLFKHKGKMGCTIEIKVTEASGAEGLSYKVVAFVGDYF
jgi:hypothetical protein